MLEANELIDLVLAVPAAIALWPIMRGWRAHGLGYLSAGFLAILGVDVLTILGALTDLAVLHTSQHVVFALGGALFAIGALCLRDEDPVIAPRRPHEPAL